MRDGNQLLVRQRTFTDAALDGLFGGLAGGITMALYLILWGVLASRTATAVLALFDGNMQDVALRGALTHLAVSAVYGLLWGVLRRVLRVRSGATLAGAAYGLALFALAAMVLLPLASSPLAEIPALHFGIAHLVYGATLGYVSSWIAARGT